MRLLPYLFSFCLCFSISIVPAFAGWQAVVPEEAGKLPMLVAVDKSRQSAQFFGQKASELSSQKVPCSSGQVKGDKQREGDRKTPEGIYFVEKRRTSGLDYALYGQEAYTLNYPNPVDKLREKNGHGIWIHGRGTPIVPRETKGCIALNNPDIADLYTKVTVNTPVILAEQVVPYFRSESEFNELKEKTFQWVAAWQDRSPEYLQMFSPEAFTKSMKKPFSSFKQQKERLFSRLPWIITWTNNVNVLQGPDYWVTWFDQYYHAPNLVTQGVRRLYWQKNSDGEFVIVGMEWKERKIGIEKAYLDAVAASVHNFLDTWVTDWKNGTVDKYISRYAIKAVQGSHRGVNAIANHKRKLWQQKKPAKIVLSDIKMSMSRRGLEVTMNQYYEDSTGYSDQGTKTLVLLPKDGQWVIVIEEWRS
ncbi:L,D-transpeptidase family protein [Halodesulfovibrio marinisediminis]|uniref:Murein L,D-transpeptidase YafK n=1 Tax=Halodesulfovibrio marinisediminis DSM 17456 TaxID=1121457 RepID=A0A1N6FRM8_9BACT|nr:L,D-transpeptidase family protein [Halodesulfovibrio marinisediminis]SIN97898.1 Murein L,D-transpeptidase YafK [Halodesulfovibrio marinisediminis DSM 17456]